MRLRFPRFRITLRVLLLLVAAIAALLGWQLKRQRDLKRAIEAIEAKGGIIFHRDQLRNNPVTTAEPSWFRQLMGETAFDDVDSVAMNDEAFTDEDVEYLTHFPSIRQLSLAGSRVSDTSMEMLQRLPNLRFLDVTDTRVTSRGWSIVRAGRPALRVHFDYNRR